MENDYAPNAKEAFSRNSRGNSSRLKRLALASILAVSTSLSGCSTGGTNLLQGFAVDVFSTGVGSYVGQKARNAAGGQMHTVNGGYQGAQAQTRTPAPYSDDDFILFKRSAGGGDISGSVVEYIEGTVRFFNGKRIVDIPVEDIFRISDINTKGTVDPTFAGFSPGQVYPN